MSMSQDASPQTSPAVSGTPPSSASTAVHTRQQAEAQSSSVDAYQKATPVGAGDPLFHQSSASDGSNTSNTDDAVDSARPSSIDPKSYVEAIADETMQDVFDDVDRMLSNGVRGSHSSLTDDRLGEVPTRFSVDSLTLGGALAPIDPSQASESSLAIPTEDNDEHLLGESPASSPERFKTFLTTLSLMVAASVALGIGLALWMGQRSRVELAAEAGVSSAVPPTTTSEFLDGSFEKYFSEALAAIDRRYEDAEAQEPESSLLPPPPPPPPGSGHVPLAIDRGYIDVYQQPQVANVPPTTAATPSTSSQSSTATLPNDGSSASVQNISPSNTYTLVGILELGDRSAAIFEYAGSAHRIEVGAQIGRSGWSLVSVSGQEAIIRRNGEVRSIYMEQSF